MKKNLRMLICIFLLSGLIVDLLNICSTFGRIMNLTENVGDTSYFRRQQLSQETLTKLQEQSEEEGISLGTLLAVWMPIHKFSLYDEKSLTPESYQQWNAYLIKYRKEAYLDLISYYQAIWDDLTYFPVNVPVTYEDSWMYERNYGGKRGHEGTDLMPPKDKSGVYPIFSMTDGVVEKVGWLEKGGYRIGIRSPHGGYFYYAHLSSYGQDFKEGDIIQAGEVLGYMGDTGYGEEGTTGQFDVHLHLGIYISTADNEELSVNPYWILKSLEAQKLKYRYYM